MGLVEGAFRRMRGRCQYCGNPARWRISYLEEHAQWGHLACDKCRLHWENNMKLIGKPFQAEPYERS